MKHISIILLFLLFFSILTQQTFGQDKEDADKLFYEGLELYYKQDYIGALGKWQESLKIYTQINEEQDNIGTVSENIGNVYSDLGDYPKALEYYNKALEITKKIDNESDRYEDEAHHLGNIGVIYQELGDYPKALEYYNKALEIKKKIGIDTFFEESKIGYVYIKQGKFQEALYKINSLPEGSGKTRFLGEYYLHIKDYGKAKEQYSKILPEYEKQRSSGLFTLYINLGLCEEGLKNYSEAEKYFKKSVDFTERQRENLSKEQKKNFFEARYRLLPYEGLCRVLHSLNKDSEAIYYAESTKARILMEQMAGKYQESDFSIPSDISLKETELTNSIASIYKQMEKAYEQNNQTRITELESQLKPLKEEQEKFITKLRQDYPEYAAITYPKPFKLEDVKMSSDIAVIEYEVTDTETIAWLIKEGKIIKTIAIPVTREDLNKLVKEYRGNFDAVGSTSDLASFKPETGKKLYDLLLKDLLSGLKGEKLIIIPDEILGTLPFEALIIELPKKTSLIQGKYGSYPEGIKYVGDTCSICYYQSMSSLNIGKSLTAATVFLGEIKHDKVPSYDKSVKSIGNTYSVSYYQSLGAYSFCSTLNPGTDAKGLFAVGDPVFSDKDERLSSAPQVKKTETTEFEISLQNALVKDGYIKFIRLPDTGTLITDLEKTFKGEIKSLSGINATEKAVKSEKLSGYRYLLFATHGILDDDVPYIQEPALVLCQINNDEKYDGLLTMTEVMGIKMGADVAVLSACNTGVGKSVSGEGVMGMGRAFQYSGVKSILMSLWSVESKSTNIMVEKYFELLKSGKDKRQALKEAKDYIRKEGYEHPFYWAPFIMVGE